MELTDLAARVRVGLPRHQVVVGHERLPKLLHQRVVGLVWLTEDLARHSVGKIRVLCARYQVPVFCAGDSEELGQLTGVATARVYILRTSFSGLPAVLRELAAWSARAAAAEAEDRP